MAYPPAATQYRFLWLLGALGAAVVRVYAEDSSFSNLDLDATEAKVALQMALEENAGLREKLAVSDAISAKLTESLAVANSEAEVFRRQTGELKLRLEALGFEGSGANTGKLEQRLLKAVSDLRLADEERKRLREALLGLSEAVVSYVRTATAPNPESRVAVEAQMRRANDALAGTTPPTVNPTEGAALTDATVLSIKDELNLVVANIGARQGVKVGMPFQVIRGGQLVGTVRVVDVRERIAGAVVQNLSSDKEKIRVGDRLKIEALP